MVDSSESFSLLLSSFVYALFYSSSAIEHLCGPQYVTKEIAEGNHTATTLSGTKPMA
jgi:hypothetical protein